MLTSRARRRLNARPSIRSVSLFAILLLAACSSSQTEQVAQQAKTAKSAGTTAHVITEAWLAGTIPSHYALRALNAMGETIERSRRAIESSAALGLNERARALAPIRQMDDAVKRAHAGIGEADHGAVAAAGSSLPRP
jgi:hypothetical protein